MVIIETVKCVGCGGCVNLCPDTAMSLSDKDLIAVDEKLCSKCQICIKACPVRALSM